MNTEWQKSGVQNPASTVAIREGGLFSPGVLEMPPAPRAEADDEVML
jgi:hypothetical protein